MAGNIKILGIAGSVRKASFNKSALREAQKLVPQGASMEIFDIDGLPNFNQDEEKNPPAKVTELKARIRAADAILFVTPEYNYSIPAPLKNTIDWISRAPKQPFAGKAAATMGASTGLLGGVRAQLHLRHSMVFLDMHPVNKPEVMIAKAAEKFDAELNLTDLQARDLVAKLLHSLVAWTRRLSSGSGASR